jgi:hypothetical protein
VRTGTDARSATEIAEIALRTRPDGSCCAWAMWPICEGRVDRDRAYFVGDNPAISMRVDRSEPQGDAIAIQDTVAQVAER